MMILMKITTILGSPRKNGNTARLLAAFEALASQDFGITRINVVDRKIAGCLGCDACQAEAGVPGCRQRDDFGKTMDRIAEADAVVYAAPVYVWDFPAQMKALMDRHYCLVKWKGRDAPAYALENKPAALLATCGGAASDNADLLMEAFEREMHYLRFKVIGKYVLGGFSAPAAPAAELPGAAGKLAADLRDFFRRRRPE